MHTMHLLYQKAQCLFLPVLSYEHSLQLCPSTFAHSTVREDMIKMCFGGVTLYPQKIVCPCSEMN